MFWFQRTYQSLARASSELVQIQSIKHASTYKAGVLKKYGESLEITDMKRQKLQKNEVRMAVYACGVNASDMLMVENKYDHDIKLPFVPGFEVCGEVLELGADVKTVGIGQRIVGLNKDKMGGFAEECILDQRDVWSLDMAVNFEQGASLPENYATALLGLHRRAKIGSSSSVLVTAAAGGLGLAAVDLASNVYQSKVIGVCGTEDKADLVRQKGAWAALKYNPSHIMKKVKEVTEGKGVDVIFDGVGGDVFSNCLPCVGFEGRVLVAGFASRIIPHIETSLLLPNTISLIGVALSHYRRANHPVYRQAVEDVIDMHESGYIKPHVSATFPLTEVSKAFDFIKERKSTGKVVLEIR